MVQRTKEHACSVFLAFWWFKYYMDLHFLSSFVRSVCSVFVIAEQGRRFVRSFRVFNRSSARCWSSLWFCFSSLAFVYRLWFCLPSSALSFYLVSWFSNLGSYLFLSLWSSAFAAFPFENENFQIILRHLRTKGL